MVSFQPRQTAQECWCLLYTPAPLQGHHAPASNGRTGTPLHLARSSAGLQPRRRRRGSSRSDTDVPRTARLPSRATPRSATKKLALASSWDLGRTSEWTDLSIMPFGKIGQQVSADIESPSLHQGQLYSPASGCKARFGQFQLAALERPHGVICFTGRENGQGNVGDWK